MEQFKRAIVRPESIASVRAALRETYSDEQVDQIMAERARDEIYLNEKYQVALRRITLEIADAEMVHLSIKRLDRQIVRDWRDLQEIKNQLVGEECEGVELFPSESRLVDTANQYHLWVFTDPNFGFPFGFDERLVTGEAELPDLPSTSQRQR